MYWIYIYIYTYLYIYMCIWLYVGMGQTRVPLYTATVYVFFPATNGLLWPILEWICQGFAKKLQQSTGASEESHGHRRLGFASLATKGIFGFIMFVQTWRTINFANGQFNGEIMIEASYPRVPHVQTTHLITSNLFMDPPKFMRFVSWTCWCWASMRGWA